MMSRKASLGRSRRSPIRYTDPGTRQESDFAAVVEGEHAAAARNHVDDEICMLPSLELGRADVGRSTADVAEQDIHVPDREFALAIAHRRRSIAATSELVKQDRAVLGGDPFDEAEGCRRRRDFLLQGLSSIGE